MEEIKDQEQTGFSGVELAAELEASQVETDPSLNPEVLAAEKLHPAEELDELGNGHFVYTLGERQFSFKGREEMPIYPALTERKTTLVGEHPAWAPEAEFTDYVAGFGREGGEHLVANRSLAGVVELATALGAGDPELEQIAADAREGKYGARALEIIDSVIAASYVDPQAGKYRPPEAPNLHGEALVALSLLGDAEAGEFVAEAKETMRQLDESKETRERQEHMEQKNGVEAYPLDKLAVVHATRFEPTHVGEGQWELRTTQDATNARFLRNSVHLTLNHKVESHYAGNWRDASYVLIAPLDKAIEDNGNPEVLKDIDTWWPRNPGEALTLREGVLIKPGSGNELVTFNGDTVEFKSQDLKPDDLKALLELAKAEDIHSAVSGGITREFVEDAAASFVSSIRWEVANSYDPSTDLYQGSVAGKLGLGIESSYTAGKLLSAPEVGSEVLDTLTSSDDFSQAAEKIIARFVPESEGKLTPEIIAQLAGELEGTLVGLVEDMAVRLTLKNMGMAYLSGGMHEGYATQSIGALAAEMGVLNTLHANTTNSAAEDAFNSGIKTGKDTDDASQYRFDPNFDESRLINYVSLVDPKTRRAIYQGGFITGHSSKAKPVDDRLGFGVDPL